MATFGRDALDDAAIAAKLARRHHGAAAEESQC